MEEVDIQIIFVITHGPDMAVRFRAAKRDRLLRVKQRDRIVVRFVKQLLIVPSEGNAKYGYLWAVLSKAVLIFCPSILWSRRRWNRIV